MMMPAAAHPTLSVAAILAESAIRVPQNTAVIAGAQHISYSQLWRETCAYAGVLRNRGIKPGDAVALMIPNIPDFPRVYYAILALGAVAVPIHPLLKASEIDYVLRDSGARILIAADTCLAEAEPATAALGVSLVTVGNTQSPHAFAIEAASCEPLDWYRPMSPLDPAAILYTSGTSGKPKGAVISHFSLLEQTHISLLDSFDVGQDDVLCATLPLSHVFGQSNVLNTAFRRGAAILLIPRFDADTVLEAMIRENVTIFAGVPTMFIGLLDAARRNPLRPPLRYAISGGASLNVAVLESVSAEFDITVYEGYGLTETAPTATFNHYGQETKPGSIGTPVWGVDVRIADPHISEHNVFLKNGEPGEVVIRGHGLFLRYHGLAQETAEAVVDGWFRTGDLGIREDSGHITIVDRKKDLILRGGYNIYPREIEEVLARIPGVRSVAVFGIPDVKHGQEIVAAIVPSRAGSVDEATIVAYAKKHIAAHKYPREIVLLSELPLGPSGKVLKRVLAAHFDGSTD
tara:strand:+ start:3771 stop:5324 length:1554 start_codon:yes stop_codon:yes gene_type:complete